MQATTFHHAWRSVLLFSGLVFNVTAAAPSLSYQFKAGSNYVYAVKIEATEPKFIATSTGNLTYSIKSANQDWPCPDLVDRWWVSV